MNTERVELLAQVAGMYYVENLTQDQVSKKLGYSRSMISRLLTEARETGVVEIRINHKVMRNYKLEQQLIRTFSLNDARILSRGTMDEATMLRYLGSVAASYLQTIIHSDMRIGVGWGSALWETISALRSMDHTSIEVVGLIGALGTMNGEMDGPEIARRLARLFGGSYSILPAPLIVENEVTRQALMNDQRIISVLETAGKADMALVGIGSTELGHSSLVRAGYMRMEEIQELSDQGIAGDVCAIHFDMDGNIADVPLNRGVVGIRHEALKKIPLRVAIAGGAAKIKAIQAACLSGLINVLITDEIAAQGILQRNIE